MGDILTNLPAALDHAIYGHATARQSLNAAAQPFNVEGCSPK
jgi:hypothetical protein